MIRTHLTEDEAVTLAVQLDGEPLQDGSGEWGVLIHLQLIPTGLGMVFFVSNSGDFTYESRDAFLRGEGPMSSYDAWNGRRLGD